MESVKPENIFLTYKELALRWKMKINTLRIWVMEGKLKPIRLGRVVRFRLSYIMELENEGLT